MSGMPPRDPYMYHGKLVSGGRLQIPAEVRRELQLADGDEVRMDIVDGDLRIRPRRGTFKRIAARLRRYIPEGVSLADELIAERRAESARE